jgi:hypothetical protein
MLSRLMTVTSLHGPTLTGDILMLVRNWVCISAVTTGTSHQQRSQHGQTLLPGLHRSSFLCRESARSSSYSLHVL